MRKFLSALIVLAGISFSSYGQTTSPKKTTAPTVLKTIRGGTVLNAAPVKTDGTPDMRYKANKKAAKAAPRLKKDGTPDRRFKRNKRQ